MSKYKGIGDGDKFLLQKQMDAYDNYNFELKKVISLHMHVIWL